MVSGLVDLIRGLLGAAVVLTFPLVLSYVEYRLEKRKKNDKNHIRNTLFNHLDNHLYDLMNKFNK